MIRRRSLGLEEIDRTRRVRPTQAVRDAAQPEFAIRESRKLWRPDLLRGPEPWGLGNKIRSQLATPIWFRDGKVPVHAIHALLSILTKVLINLSIPVVVWLKGDVVVGEGDQSWRVGRA